MNPALLSIMKVLENETVDDITKWRNFCFTQTVRLRATEFMHYQKGLEYKQKADKLTKELSELTQKLKSLTDIKETVEKSLKDAADVEKEINDKFRKMKVAKDNDAILMVKLTRAPEVFMSIYQGHQLTRIPDIDKMFSALQKRSEAMVAQLGRIRAKIETLTKIMQDRRDDIRQNKIIGNRLQDEIKSLTEQIDGIEIPDLPSEVLSISSQFENAAEASKRLLTIEREIAELQTKMSNIHLDNRPSEAALIEGLIEKERENHEQLMQSVIEKYDTNDLEQEIAREKDELRQLSEYAGKVRDECLEKQKQIKNDFDAEKEEYTRQINENETTIKDLREKIADMSSRLPLHGHASKTSVGTQTIYCNPSYF